MLGSQWFRLSQWEHASLIATFEAYVAFGLASPFSQMALTGHALRAWSRVMPTVTIGCPVLKMEYLEDTTPYETNCRAV